MEDLITVDYSEEVADLVYEIPRIIKGEWWKAKYARQLTKSYKLRSMMHKEYKRRDYRDFPEHDSLEATLTSFEHGVLERLSRSHEVC